MVRMLGSAPHATRRPFVSSRALGLVLRCLCHSLFLRCGAAFVEFFGHLRTGTVEVRDRIPSQRRRPRRRTSCNGFQVAGRSSEWEDDLVDRFGVAFFTGLIPFLPRLMAAQPQTDPGACS